MASLISSIFSNREKKYEVFISFRGEDTRNTFVSYLHAAFERANITTYIDYKLERGTEISESLVKAIEDSQLSVIVFSENFANSKWCLDEVEKIMKCKRRRGQIVVPIFYHIVPTIVQNQSGTYATAFEAHKSQFWYNPIKTTKWRKALENVVNLSGWSCSVDEMESIVVENIAKYVLKRLNRVDARPHPTTDMILPTSLFSNKEKKYEVFISFRGVDLLTTFVSHLHAAFQRAKINTYIDYNLKRGDDISKTLLKVIEDSLLSVIVFSENFANSKWCLDEVQKIMKCKKKMGQIVVPIFYHIEPTHVRKQTGTFASAFAEYERQFCDKSCKIRKWKKALEFAAGLAGENVSVNNKIYLVTIEYLSMQLQRLISKIGLEATSVEKIVKDVLDKLNHEYVSDLDEKIKKYQQHAICQKACVENIMKLQSERDERLRRIRETRCQ